MLKIAPAGHDRVPVETLYLGGKLMGPWVDELRRVCEEILAAGAYRLVLDFRDVTFLDAAGVALVRQLAGRDVSLTHCSPFVTAQLERAMTLEKASER
jgi:anti-anti-sigma regulatory factor